MMKMPWDPLDSFLSSHRLSEGGRRTDALRPPSPGTLTSAPGRDTANATAVRSAAGQAVRSAAGQAVRNAAGSRARSTDRRRARRRGKGETGRGCCSVAMSASPCLCFTCCGLWLFGLCSSSSVCAVRRDSRSPDERHHDKKKKKKKKKDEKEK